jgi:hypothetical protein
MRVAVLALAAAVWAGSFGGALACQCGGPNGPYDEVMRWRLERSGNVVRGRVVEFRADEKTVRDSGHVAVAKMRVKSIVKGAIPAGDLTLVTASSGDGSCSMASALLSAVASKDDVIMSVGDARNFRGKREYAIDSCGYFANAPSERASQLNR